MQPEPNAPHIPVLIDDILRAVSPVSGDWIDGTFGAGGYSRAFLEAGATRVFGIDRDPEVFERAESWSRDFGERLVLLAGEFGNLDRLVGEHVSEVSGVVLDIGVSSMQLDQPERGFSFMADGPLDMRMAQSGVSAADIVNRADEGDLANILYLYGEERASRRIARNIVAARKVQDITTTAQLVDIIERSLPRPKPKQAHPATRSFQALRIAVNDELGQLVAGLQAAENILCEGGLLAVVTFHSLEDRIVKRFMAQASGDVPRGNRFTPEAELPAPRFERVSRKAITASDVENAANPRARSAKLRVARRLAADPIKLDPKALGLPRFDLEKVV